MPLDPHAFALARTFEERNGLQVAELNKLARRLSGETWAAIQDNSIVEAKYATDSVSDRALAAGVALQNIGTGGIGDGYIAGLQASKVSGTLSSATIPAANVSGTLGTGQLAIGAATTSASAVGATSSPAPSGSYTVIPEMLISLATLGGLCLVSFFCTIYGNNVGGIVNLKLQLDGADISSTVTQVVVTATTGAVANLWPVAITTPITPSAGTHNFSAAWQLGGGGAVANGVQRSISAVEFRR